MKRIIIFVFTLIIAFSCSKTSDHENDILTCDCSHYMPVSDSIGWNGTSCQSDTCQTYSGIWKELFLARNEMTQEYFNNHITLCNTYVQKWDDGISFEISYKVKTSWASAKLYDKFVIWLSPSTSGVYPLLDIPRSTILTKEQINKLVANNAFNSEINRVASVTQLKYASKEEALNALILASGVDTLCTGTVYFQNPNLVQPSAGHPFLEASGVLNWNENKCITGQMDLVTGETKITRGVCIINFCFTKGTQIILKNSFTKSIENVRPGDTILSVNMETMIVENDVVKQVDSVTHRNIIEIIFSDLSINHNTFDHPYFVKGKGWCSYRPIETYRKYKLKTLQLQAGDTCLTYHDNKLIEIQVKTIAEQIGDVITYNLSRLERNKSFFANGILVSNEGN